MTFKTQDEIVAILREYGNSVENIHDFSSRKGLNSNTVRNWVKRAGLEVRNRFPLRKKLDWEFIKTQL